MTMASYQWSEIFLSIEGEARYSGYPTVFVRFTGCNFTCRGFNNPSGAELTNDVLGVIPSDYQRLQELPVVTRGCDSIYSWDTRFKHLWHKGDEHQLARAISSVIPGQTWQHPATGLDVILSLTGGEPTLRARTLPSLLATPALEGVKKLLFETNCAVPLPDEFIAELDAWAARRPGRLVIWSNSPKLSVSGEAWSDAIRPDIAMAQRQVSRAEQYFKFVCDDDPRDFREIAKAMDEYHRAGVPGDSSVYVMPSACTTEQQDRTAANIAHKCMYHGYIYCHRIQNSVFGNLIGT